MFLNISFVIHLPVYLLFFDFGRIINGISNTPKFWILGVIFILSIIRLFNWFCNVYTPNLLNIHGKILIDLWLGIIGWIIFFIAAFYYLFTQRIRQVA
jgi:hypothetical protein